MGRGSQPCMFVGMGVAGTKPHCVIIALAQALVLVGAFRTTPEVPSEVKCLAETGFKVGAVVVLGPPLVNRIAS
jgi:hypothetical protein